MSGVDDDAEPCWKVGELARLTGLTVRTLHHYDEVGLLVPSARSAGDHRRYGADDLRRLLAIGHLKSLGLSLEDVRAALDEPGFDLGAALRDQADVVRARLAQEERLLGRLEALAAGGVAEVDDVVEAIALTERLANPDPTVRTRAALEAPGTAPLGELLERLRTEPVPGVRETLTWAVVQHGVAATSAVLAGLGDGDPAVRLQLAHVLSKLRDPAAAPALVDLLDDPEPRVAAKAAFALGRIGGRVAAVALVARLGDRRPEVVDDVVAALGRCGAVVAAEIVAALEDADPRVRAAAAEVAGDLGLAAAVAGLAGLLSDRDRDVALVAALSLGRMATPESRRALANATKVGQVDPRTRTVIERVLRA